jgi:hypothetical protein
MCHSTTGKLLLVEFVVTTFSLATYITTNSPDPRVNG